MITKTELQELFEISEKQEGSRSLLVFDAIEKHYRYLGKFDTDIECWLNSMYYFACDGEFLKLIEIINTKTFN